MSDIEEPIVDEVSVQELVEDEPEFAGVNQSATEIKLFGKWSFAEIEVADISLAVCFYNCV